jgi:hypothetical protein
MEALRDAPYNPSPPKMTEDRQKGIMTCRRFDIDGRTMYGLTVYDVQSWMGRKNESLPAWILKAILEHAAMDIIARGGKPAKNQIYMDKEMGYAD